MNRTAQVTRETTETTVSVDLDIDGTGVADIDTGIGFLNHLLTSLAKHARLDLTLRCRGDLIIDDHHSVEDCGIVLGWALGEALGDRSGIARFASAYAPLDEALARAVVDVSGRGGAWVSLDLRRESIGGLSTENIPHFMESLARSAGVTLHLDVLRGGNDHHRAEAAFKAFALALRSAIAKTGEAGVPSTKGRIDGPPR